MTGEVIGAGDDGRGPGRLVGVVVTVALLGVFGVAVARNRPGREERAAPTPAPVRTATASATPLPPAPGDYVPPDHPVFETFGTYPSPADGEVRGVLFPGGLPGFLVGGDGDDLPVALEATGGPEHARVLLGYCRQTGMFADAEHTHAYNGLGRNLAGGRDLPERAVRVSLVRGGSVDVAGAPGGVVETPPGPTGEVSVRCPGPLAYPPLPPDAASVHDTIRGYRVVRGRHVVTTESAAFCAPRGPGCAAQGWEVHGEGSLPQGDLAGGYTWEGRFVVRGDPDDGTLDVVRLPGARLVARTRVGATVRVGLGNDVVVEGDVAYLRFNPFRHRSGTPEDDSPAGPPQPAPDSAHLMTDVRGGLRTYEIRPDADLYLGEGFTGLGLPRATADTLRRFLEDPAKQVHPLWVVLDARGRVLRVAID